MRDNNIPFEYHTKSIRYEYDGKEHYYIPDFKVYDRLVEIKGDHILKKNVFNKNDNRVNAKFQCMKDNNVLVLTEIDIKPFIEYVKINYGGKSYLKSLRKY